MRFDGPREVGTEKLLSARGVESDGVRVVVRACARCGSGGDGKGWRSRMGDMEGAEAGEISCVSMDRGCVTAKTKPQDGGREGEEICSTKPFLVGADPGNGYR